MAGSHVVAGNPCVVVEGTVVVVVVVAGKGVHTAEDTAAKYSRFYEYFFYIDSSSKIHEHEVNALKSSVL